MPSVSDIDSKSALQGDTARRAGRERRPTAGTGHEIGRKESNMSECQSSDARTVLGSHRRCLLGPIRHILFGIFQILEHIMCDSHVDDSWMIHMRLLSH